MQPTAQEGLRATSITSAPFFADLICLAQRRLAFFVRECFSHSGFAFPSAHWVTLLTLVRAAVERNYVMQCPPPLLLGGGHKNAGRQSQEGVVAGAAAAYCPCSDRGVLFPPSPVPGASGNGRRPESLTLRRWRLESQHCADGDWKVDIAEIGTAESALRRL